MFELIFIFINKNNEIFYMEVINIFYFLKKKKKYLHTNIQFACIHRKIIKTFIDKDENMGFYKYISNWIL